MKKIVFTIGICFFFVLLIAQTKKKAPTAPPASKVAIQRGEQVYKTTCIVCHQKDGGGVPRLNPPLIQTGYVLGDKSRLVNIVLKGLNESIEIEGETYDNAMPSFAQLTDQQIADVLTYVRNSFGNKASGVSVAEVKAIRAKASL